MIRAAFVCLLVHAGCGSEPDLRDIEGSLDPAQVEPFLMKLAQHCRALSAEKAASMAERIRAMEAPADSNTRLATRVNGELVSVLEFNVSKTGSGKLSIRIRVDRAAADAVRPTYNSARSTKT